MRQERTARDRRPNCAHSSHLPARRRGPRCRRPRTRSPRRGENAHCRGSSRSAANGKTGRASPSGDLPVGRLAGERAIERVIAKRGAGEGEMPGARLCRQAQPPAFAAIFDQVRESGPPAARIFGRQEDRRTVPGLAQRGDVAQRQRAAGGGGFENARGLTARSAPALHGSRPQRAVGAFLPHR